MISFVYFDVGGVAIKDFSKSNKWEEFQRGLGIKEKGFDTFTQWFETVESNLCLDKEFDALIPELEQRFNIILSTNFSLLTDMVGRFEPNPTIWPVIKTIKETVKVGLLTNMYVGMFKEIEKRGILPPIKWDVIIDSSTVKLKKPDPKMFMLAQAKAGVKAEEILFVENSAMHVEAAKKLGWQTFLYDSTDYEGSSKKLTLYLKGQL
jgi:FMN phosphatase YigB (HAD superfamily)